jgi:hypothetical protein
LLAGTGRTRALRIRDQSMLFFHDAGDADADGVVHDARGLYAGHARSGRLLRVRMGESVIDGAMRTADAVEGLFTPSLLESFVRDDQGNA